MAFSEGANTDANSGFIGEGVVFKGSITAPDTLVVHGVVEGDVTARSVLVGASGTIKGSLKSVEAEIHGKVGDDLEVQDFLHLSPTSQVEGTVFLPRHSDRPGRFTEGELHFDRGGRQRQRLGCGSSARRSRYR